MADKTTSTDTLNLIAAFYDGDTRTITQTDPKPASQLPALIREFQADLQANKTIIGDKAGGSFKEFTEAKIVHKTVTQFDLGI